VDSRPKSATSRVPGGARHLHPHEHEKAAAVYLGARCRPSPGSPPVRWRPRPCRSRCSTRISYTAHLAGSAAWAPTRHLGLRAPSAGSTRSDNVSSRTPRPSHLPGFTELTIMALRARVGPTPPPPVRLRFQNESDQCDHTQSKPSRLLRGAGRPEGCCGPPSLAGTTRCGRPRRDLRVLVYSRTGGFVFPRSGGCRHRREARGSARLRGEASEDPAVFTDGSCAVTAVVFLNHRRGDVHARAPGAEEVRARRCGKGGAPLGADPEYDWPFYTRLLAGDGSSPSRPAAGSSSASRLRKCRPGTHPSVADPFEEFYPSPQTPERRRCAQHRRVVVPPGPYTALPSPEFPDGDDGVGGDGDTHVWLNKVGGVLAGTPRWASRSGCTSTGQPAAYPRWHSHVSGTGTHCLADPPGAHDRRGSWYDLPRRVRAKPHVPKASRT